MYDYDRTKVAVAGGNPNLSYEKRLSYMRSNFTEEVGEKVFDYINTTHKRLSNRPPFDGISGFLSWDYGTPKDLDDSSWGIRVWQKSASQYPNGIDPNLYINLDFSLERIVAYVEAGSKQVFSKVYAGTISSVSLGMAIGEAWEKLLTGTVDYGD